MRHLGPCRAGVTAAGKVTQMITYQGRLTDTDGKNRLGEVIIIGGTRESRDPKKNQLSWWDRVFRPGDGHCLPGISKRDSATEESLYVHDYTKE